MGNCKLKWFAMRVIKDKSYVLRLLECKGWEVSRIKDIPSLLFLHVLADDVEDLRTILYDRAFLYRNADRTRVEPIPDNVMNTFLLLAPFHDEPVFYLSVDDPHFFEGERKRVISGVFAGCEGVIKRIKGEKRLIVKINDRAAIATPYIPKGCLENIDNK